MIPKSEIKNLSVEIERAINEKIAESKQWSTGITNESEKMHYDVSYRIIDGNLLPPPHGKFLCPGHENWIPLNTLIDYGVVSEDWCEDDTECNNVLIEVLVGNEPCPEFFAVGLHASL